MKIFNFLFFILVVIAASCSNEQPDDAKLDSVSDSMSVTEIETDSGKLVITKIPGQELDAVVHYGKDGKIAGRGFLFNGKQSGAWIHYDAEGNIVKAEHYSDGVVKYNLDVTDFQTSRVTFKEMGISMAVPSQWKSLETPNPANLISYEKEVTEEGILIMPNFNVARGKLDPGQTLELLAEQQMKMLHDVVGRVETVHESYVTVDSCRTFLRYGKYYTENNMIGFLDAIVIKGDTMWVISCAAQNREEGEFLKYQSVFENLVMSIQFLN